MLASKMKTFSPPASMHLQPNCGFSFVCLSEVNLEGPRITMETNLKGLSGGEFLESANKCGKACPNSEWHHSMGSGQSMKQAENQHFPLCLQTVNVM